jgi:hypothetical protein
MKSKMKIASLLIAVGQVLTTQANLAIAQDQPYHYAAESDFDMQRKHVAVVETRGADNVLDIPLRLGGFIVTVVGTGIFVGTSPISGLMTALYPHDAIDKAADFLVVRPGRFTFVRPSGVFDYDSRSSDEK